MTFRGAGARPGRPAAAGLALLLALGLAGAGCGESRGAPPAGEAPLPRVPAAEVERRDLSLGIEVPATVRAFEAADLFARIGGYLESIPVDLGDAVTKGQVVARLSVPEMERERDQKEAELARARAGVEEAREEAAARGREKRALVALRETERARWTELLEGAPAIDRRKADEARYQLEAARAALEAAMADVRAAEAGAAAARAALETARAGLRIAEAGAGVAGADLERVASLLGYVEITAPFDGVVTRRLVDPGAFVQPALTNSAARPLVTIQHLDRVRVQADLPMDSVALLDPGDRAVLDRIPAAPGVRLEGAVTRLARALDEGSRMMRVEVHFENPPGPGGRRALRPGDYGTLAILLEERPGTPCIPASALAVEGEESFVYVIEGEVCRRRAVRTGYKDGTWVGIVSGLSPGERVVASGTGQIRDGQRVIPVPAGRGEGR